MKRGCLLGGLLMLLGCQDSGGCGNDYPYPRTDPLAAPSLKAVRGRLSEAGIATAARAIPDLLTAACAANPADGTKSCALDPVTPGRVRFYLGTEAEPVTFNVVASQGEVLPPSFVAVDLQSLHNNLHVQLVDVVGGQDGVRVSVGCTAADFDACTDPSTFVDGSLDLTLYLEGVDVPLVGSWGESVCFAQDNSPTAPGLRIQSLIFTFYPRIEVAADGRPYLHVEENDMVVERMEVGLDVQTGKACWESTCGACGSGECSLCTAADVLTDYVLEPFLETGSLARRLTTLVAKQLLASVAEGALDVAGELDATSVLTFVNPRAEPTKYLLAANADSPSAGGSSSALGMNLDFDVGFIAKHGACVPMVEPPSWVMPSMPDPGAYVLAPDPVTGDMTPEAYDAALIVGDGVPGRALFDLFDGGSLCLNLDSALLGSLTQGVFAPTVASLGVIAPGLAGLAPPNAPVSVVTAPSLPAQLRFGTGMVAGGTRDSHLQLVWPSFGVELWPWVDQTYQRAIALSCDLAVGLSFEPTPSGNLLITVDRIALDNVLTTYNEIPLQFDAQGLTNLVAAFVPSLVSGEPFDVQLTAAALGFPFVPKARAITTLGADKRFLGVFLRFCAPRDLADATNPLCYEPRPAPGDKAQTRGWLELEPLDELTTTMQGHWRVRAHSDLAPGPALELALRVDGGATLAFRAADRTGVVEFYHPTLALPGRHHLEVLGRVGKSLVWTTPYQTTVTVLEPAVPDAPALVMPARKAPTPVPFAEGCQAVPVSVGGAALVALAYVARHWRRRCR